MAEPLLQIHELRRRYGRTTALDGVSFEVAAGERFGLLGPNGAGKTTLLSIVSCLLEPTSGEVRILGAKLRPAIASCAATSASCRKNWPSTAN